MRGVVRDEYDFRRVRGETGARGEVGENRVIAENIGEQLADAGQPAQLLHRRHRRAREVEKHAVEDESGEVPRDRDEIDVGELKPGVLKAPVDRVDREVRGLLLPVEPFLLGGGDDLAVHHQRRGRVVTEDIVLLDADRAVMLREHFGTARPAVAPQNNHRKVSFGFYSARKYSSRRLPAILIRRQCETHTNNYVFLTARREFRRVTKRPRDDSRGIF